MPEIVGLGGPRDRAALQLSTRLGNHIANARRHEMAPDARRASVRKWASEFPQARLRSITATYNCFGMVFGNRRTWVLEEALELIKNDDGYRMVLTPRVGDVAIYRRTTDVEHVGIVVEIRSNVATASHEVLVLSKWGAEGEYLHREDHVPQLLGRPAEYWTERMEEP